MGLLGRRLPVILLVTVALSASPGNSRDILIEYEGSTLWTGLGAVAAAGEYVYAATPFGVLVFKTNGRSSLELVNELLVLPGSWDTAKVVHNRLFLFSNREVAVLDISDPEHPIQGGTYPLPLGTDGIPALITGIDVVPQCTCVAVTYLGTLVTGVLHISGTNYQSPGLAASFVLAPETWGVAAGDAFEAVLGFSFPDMSFVDFINIENPRAPFWVDEYWTQDPLDYAVAAFVRGNLAYLTCVEFGLRVMLIDSTPATPVLGTYAEPSATGFRIDANRGYLFSSDSGVTTLDMLDSVTFVSLGSAVPSGSISDIDSTTFYVTTLAPELRLVDWSQPTAPVIVDSYSHFRPPTLYVAKRDTLVFVSSDTLGIQVVDVTDPASPTWIDSIPVSGSAGMSVVVGDYLYVAKQDSSIDIYDIADAGAMVVVNSFKPASKPSDFLLADTVLMVAVSDSGLQLFSVSDPAAPIPLNRVDLPGSTLGIAMDGELACAAGGSPLLKVLDVSDLAAPTLIGQFDVSTTAVDVMLSDSVAYAATGYQGLFVVDLHTPSAASLIVQYKFTGWSPMATLTVDKVGHYALVTHVGEIRILDIADPWNTSWVGVFSTPGFARQLLIEPPQIYVADYSGFTVLSVSGTVDVAEAGSVLPDRFSLGSNYPNPFNAGTSISYTILYPQKVNLAVFNVLGQPVATLVDRTLAPGSYTASWDGRMNGGREAPSGVYFYRLSAEGQNVTHKMLLLR